MKIYNKYLDQAVRTIDSVKPTPGFEKTKEFKKNLEIKKLEKQLGKKPTTQKLNKGGRVGLKRGTGLMKTKSNIKKIKETFGPKKGRLGMQSVIYGLDKNPKITAADPKAKFIAAANKKKKKVI
jgi:hypothetical protein